MNDILRRLILQPLLASTADPEALQALLRQIEEAGGVDPAPALAASIAEGFALYGVRESDGQNRGPVVDAFHELSEAAGGSGDKEDAAPWCARFVTACWFLAGIATLQRVDAAVSRSGSVFYMLHSTFNRAPELVLLTEDIRDVVHDVRPGDALIRYERARGAERVPFADLTRKDTHRGHTELVLRAYADGTLDTVGGNTDSGDSRDGDGVYFHSRRYSIDEERVVGFVRPRFVPMR